MMILASLALSGSSSMVPVLPRRSVVLVNQLSGPVLYTLGTTAFLVLLFVFRKFFVQPMVAWTVFNLSLLLLGLSMADENFAAIVMKPDNVPIVGLVYLLGVLYLGGNQAGGRQRRANQAGFAGCWKRSMTRRCSSGQIWSTRN
jgi:hypothetical protein